MKIVSFNLNNKKPLKITTVHSQYILRTISYSGDDSIVVFIVPEGKKPMRICRMNGSGSSEYLLPIDKNVSFMLKGKGTVTLTFTEHLLVSNDDTVSYMCDVITESDREKML
ncbi:hypothetical protein CL6EHI_103340 [Entamoeba histolytica]|uniref:Nucleoplasmin-like domain-containing protein n=6 Tax=Entamoeba TaxID=5758 RepID=C4LVH8_ENTH1|nr:hypothetical protein ENU1_100850 [Entamoeba nuttalli P19]XP_652430.1 hypothetical protein EHI_103340 [Entamoeba histolytica HM-1:IMSS]ENY64417.1 hypothetical protein EHI7A_047210 [Entamoeba histolytica HM-1:IMSS-A]GAT92675.1 hypothetical protein CL6EHI_103340 [Entamoeba histolytica]EAL47044.1 hypothetical protein EHI_103340 [Entamoeba histolytica HM-1:IMSS]EKE40146.1 hypothetical protein ENU1_100850 [Entamoeba nuttalli P19]|eukprot:XP_008857526.1 hypothetical protein ENU1_100850 [Entamoeba nuttalli P19]